jgi:hypothetical protein
VHRWLEAGGYQPPWHWFEALLVPWVLVGPPTWIQPDLNTLAGVAVSSSTSS